MKEIRNITNLYRQFKSVKIEEIENYMVSKGISIKYRTLADDVLLNYDRDINELSISDEYSTQGVKSDSAVYLLLYGLYYYHIGENTTKRALRKLHDAGDSYAELVFSTYYKNVPNLFTVQRFEEVNWFKQLPFYVKNEIKRKNSKTIHEIIKDKVEMDFEDSDERLLFFPVQYWCGYRNKDKAGIVNSKGLTDDEQLLMTIQVYKFFLDNVKLGNYNPLINEEGDDEIRQVVSEIQNIAKTLLDVDLFKDIDKLFEKLVV